MSYLAGVRAELASLEARALLRVPRERLPAGAVDFSSNDYLGLGRDPRVLAALAGARAGSGGSRLLGGAHAAHARLESELAAWTGRERALLFSSGYLAAIGAIVTLARFVDAAYPDALIHACAIDALRLTRLPRRIAAHAAVPAIDAGDARALVVTESIYGMDGDAVAIAPYVAALRAGDVLVSDEAHALGLTGPRGAGLAAGLHDERVVVVGTLSKALGVAGGFVAGPADVVALLASTARSFVFDTAAPPPVVEAVRAALAIVRSGEGDELRARLQTNAARVRGGLHELGFAVPAGAGAVVPVVIGAERDALALARELEARGYFAPAVRPPTVPAGTSRLRITLRADHTAADIDGLLAALAATRVAPSLSLAARDAG